MNYRGIPTSNLMLRKKKNQMMDVNAKIAPSHEPPLLYPPSFVVLRQIHLGKSVGEQFHSEAVPIVFLLDCCQFSPFLIASLSSVIQARSIAVEMRQCNVITDVDEIHKQNTNDTHVTSASRVSVSSFFLRFSA